MDCDFAGAAHGGIMGVPPAAAERVARRLRVTLLKIRSPTTARRSAAITPTTMPGISAVCRRDSWAKGRGKANTASVFIRALWLVSVLAGTKIVPVKLEAQGVTPIAELNKVKLPKFGQQALYVPRDCVV
jgi:hypothetical protein